MGPRVLINGIWYYYPMVDLTGPALAAVGFNEQIFGVNEQILGQDQSDQSRDRCGQPTLSDRCYNADAAPQVT